MKTRAIRYHKTGGPEVLQIDEVDLAEPGPNQIRVRNTAIGVNFSDLYSRAGIGRAPPLPARLGYEGAGVVEALGPGVTKFAVGDRVAYGVEAYGAYAEHHNLNVDKTHSIPDGVSDEEAAAVISKGITVYSLIKKIYAVQPKDFVLLHTIAGGVGIIACQWLKHLGATVIGTTSTPEKAELARSYGADHIILYQTEDIAKRVAEITNGAKAHVVYDGVGNPTFEASLNSLRPRGTLVAFGFSSGQGIAIPDLRILSSKGSITLVKPAAKEFYDSDEELNNAAAEIFDLVQKKIIRVRIHKSYPFNDVAQCHADLASRTTTGSCILIP